MVGWTAFVDLGVRRPGAPAAPLLVADLAVAVGAVLATPLVKGEGLQRHASPGFWVMGAAAGLGGPLGLARRAGRRRGLVARPTCRSAHDVNQGNYGNVFLLLLGGPIVGYLCESLQRMARRARPTRSGRPRRPRSGPGWRGPCTTGCSRCWRWCSAAAPSSAVTAAELGRLAGEQEAALRALIRAAGRGGRRRRRRRRDLAAALGRAGPAPARHASRRPGAPVRAAGARSWTSWSARGRRLPRQRRRARRRRTPRPGCCSRTRRPGRGLGARRGPRHPAGPARGGRGRGPARCQRVDPRAGWRDLGGTATLSTGAFGTEWELVVPRDAEGRRR